MSDLVPDVQPQKGLADFLRDFPTAPSQEQIEKWKTQFGDVYVSGFSETELYIWRAIRRSEWVSLQSRATDPDKKMDQYGFEEAVCEIAVLWKSVAVSFSDGKAGVPTSLQEQILQNSNFLSPQAASMLVAKL